MKLFGAVILGLVVLTTLCSSKNARKRCVDVRRKGAESTRHGMLGAFVPNCEKDGSYSAVQRRGSVYYCVSREGETIPGYSVTIHLHRGMNCKCARAQFEWRKKKLLGLSFRCLKNGNFAPIQCKGSVCYCVDTEGRKYRHAMVAHIGHTERLVCPYTADNDISSDDIDEELFDDLGI